MFSSYTSVQEGEVFMKNSATSKLIGEEIIQFFLLMDASLLFKAFVMFLNQDTISSLLEPYIEKGSISVLNLILLKFSKMPM